MGVTGLWKLIDRAGKQVALESLEGKIFAIDASVLLHQALKGMKDQPNAHLHVLFLRLCKLLMYRIKPIFVFDGAVPILKRQTIAARQKRREDSSALAESIRERLKRKAVQRLAIDSTLGRPSAAKQLRTEQDLFELPPLPKTELDEGEDDYFELPIHNMLYSGELDVSQVKIDSEEFNALPLEYQHEILEELKDQTKHNTPRFYIDEEKKADDFSSFQIAKLVKSNKLTNKIETLRKEMLSGLSDHAQDPNCDVLQANRVMSEDSTHYLLIKSLTPSVTASSENTFSAGDHLPSISCPATDVVQPDVDLSQPNKLSRELVSENFSDSDGLSDDDSPISSAAVSDDVTNNKQIKKVSQPNYLHLSPKLSEDESDSELEEENSHAPSAGFGVTSSPCPAVNLDSAPCSSTGMSVAAVDDSINHQLATVCKSLFDKYTQENPPDKSQEVMETIAASPIQTGGNVVQDQERVVETIITAVGERDDGSKSNKYVREVEMKAKTALNGGDRNQLIELNEDDQRYETNQSEDDAEPGGSPLSISDSEHSLEDVDNQRSAPNPQLAGLAEEILHSARDINEVNEELRSTQTHLNLDLEKQNAASLAVTQRILDDSMELLQLFGVPYLLSPSEAEAQCAQLELLGLCDGTITEDSDVWLFGGCRVLKNFFHHDRYVTSFAANDVQRYCGLDRKKFIAVALVCGSDYTEGIFGAGPVTATEILSEFGQDCDGITAMKRFKSWVDEVKAKPDVLPLSTSNSSVRRKLKRHANVIPDTFPNRVVIDAYLNPRVDDSAESFEWGRPDLDLIRKFAHKTLNWPKQKVDDLVCPVLKKLNTVQRQPKLTNFFSSFPTSINSDATFQSKRLKHAFSKLTSPSKKTDSVLEQPSASQGKTKKQKVKRNVERKNGPKGRAKVEKALTDVNHPKTNANHPKTNVNCRVIQEQVCLSEDSDD